MPNKVIKVDFKNKTLSSNSDEQETNSAMQVMKSKIATALSQYQNTNKNQKK